MMREKNWTGLKLTGIFGAFLFVGVLAYVIGNRLSSEAIAVLAGSVCGVGAAIPTSLIIMAVSRRNGGGHSETRSVPSPSSSLPGGYPPVVVVAPPGAYPQQQLPQPPQQATWGQAPATRKFTVVGEE
jgi:hypothetical protein